MVKYTCEYVREYHGRKINDEIGRSNIHFALATIAPAMISPATRVRAMVIVWLLVQGNVRIKFRVGLTLIAFATGAANVIHSESVVSMYSHHGHSTKDKFETSNISIFSQMSRCAMLWFSRFFGAISPYPLQLLSRHLAVVSSL